MKVLETLLFMFRNPIPLIVHLTCWFLLAAWGVVADDPFIEGTLPYIKVIVAPPASVGDYLKAASIIWDEVIEDLTRTGFWVLVVTPPFIICYREAVGNLKGIANEHKEWTEWYRQQQEATAEDDNFVESSPPLKNMQVNSYFRKAQKTLLFMIRNPKLPLIHFLCWMITCFLLVLISILPDLANIVRAVENFARNFLSAAPYLAIVAAIFGLISSYQETKGTVKGLAKVQQAWAEWYYQQQEAKAQGVPFDVSPPLFRMY
ncbi:hypothetical protein F4009_02745 [Candidatus Poribacteria bacterium]|nr:hypothetical protein [Candidatus Poribacteria bacterium]MYK92918.1 hypothetical protein [Candidatus Poribacteria bacterium]